MPDYFGQVYLTEGRAIYVRSFTGENSVQALVDFNGVKVTLHFTAAQAEHFGLRLTDAAAWTRIAHVGVGVERTEP